MNVQITGITWDTDGADASELELPDAVEVDLEAEGIASGEDVGDWLADKYGWCVLEFCLPAELEPGEAEPRL
jgi:hypothetical protein